MKLNCHNEWDRLREVIVGTVTGEPGMAYTTTTPLSEEKLRRVQELTREAYPQWMLNEANEDLEALCAVLRDYGVKVLRPETGPVGKAFASPYWAAGGEFIYNARDLNLVVGDTVIETPSQEKYRYYEPHAYHPIWLSYFKEGFRWIAAPRPRLDTEYMITYFEDGQRHQKLTEDEILFEAANVTRIGADLLYLVSRSGNELGAKWLQSVLGPDYRVHTTSDIYRASHIDSTVMCLRPGVVLFCAARVNQNNCPPIFNKWEQIYFSDIVKTPETTLEFHETVRKRVAKELEALGVSTDLDHIASDWIGMNFLSLDPETVVVDKRQGPLIRLLEGRGFKVIPIHFRHSHLLKGGIHCSTLDTVRESRLERYCN